MELYEPVFPAPPPSWSTKIEECLESIEKSHDLLQKLQSQNWDKGSLGNLMKADKFLHLCYNSLTSFTGPFYPEIYINNLHSHLSRMELALEQHHENNNTSDLRNLFYKLSESFSNGGLQEIFFETGFTDLLLTSTQNKIKNIEELEKYSENAVSKIRANQRTDSEDAHSKHFAENANKLDFKATLMQLVAITISIYAILAALSSQVLVYLGIAFQSNGSDGWEVITGRISATLILVGVATYFFNLASQMRKEARKYRQNEILSRTLNGFTTEMTQEEQTAFRMMVGLRLYTPDDYVDTDDERSALFKPVTKLIEKRLGIKDPLQDG